MARVALGPGRELQALRIPVGSMGRNTLVDGESVERDVEPSTDEDGAFDRVETTFSDRVEPSLHDAEASSGEQP